MVKMGQAAGRYRGLPTLSHSGNWAGFRTVLLRFPEQDFAVILLSNLSAMDPLAQARRIADLYLGPYMGERDSAPEEIALDAQAMDDYTGIYDFGAALIVRVTRLGDSLYAETAGARRRRLVPVGVDRFVAGAAFAFERDSGGTIQLLRIANQTGGRSAAYTPQADELAALEGVYYSSELEATYTLTADKGSLWAVSARQVPIQLRPATPDSFTSATWFMPVIRFSHTSERHITASKSLTSGLGTFASKNDPNAGRRCYTLRAILAALILAGLSSCGPVIPRASEKPPCR